MGWKGLRWLCNSWSGDEEQLKHLCESVYGSGEGKTESLRAFRLLWRVLSGLVDIPMIPSVVTLSTGNQTPPSQYILIECAPLGVLLQYHLDKTQGKFRSHVHKSITTSADW